MATGQNIPNSPTPPKRPWLPLLIAGGAIVLLVILTMIIISFTQGGTMTKEQAAMERYLEEKYNTDFTVKRPELTGAGLGVKGVWKTSAYPTSNGDLQFNVSASQELDSFSDQYIAALWSKEQTQKIQQDVTKIYGDDSTTKVAVKIFFSAELVKNATLESPTYEEAKTKYVDRGFYYEYTINATPNANMSSEAKKIYELIKLARENGIEKPGVRYIEKQGQDEWLSILEPSVVESITNATEVEEQLNNNRIKVED